MKSQAFLYCFQASDPPSHSTVVAESSLCTPWHCAFAFKLEQCVLERVADAKEEQNLLAQRLKDQADLINMLARPRATATFAIRTVTSPNAAGPSTGRIDIYLLGKVVVDSRMGAQTEAANLSREVHSLLSSVYRSYSWRPVCEQAEFNSVWAPVRWADAHLGEIRRREEQVPMWQMICDSPEDVPEADDASASSDLSERVYYVHPFIPRLTSLARLMHLFLAHPDRIVWQTAIAPISLNDDERAALRSSIARCERTANAVYKDTHLAGALLERKTNIEPPRLQSKGIATALLNQLQRLQSTPYILSISVASEYPLPRTLLEAIGVELTFPSGTDDDYNGHPGLLHRGGFDTVEPRTEEEARIACGNAECLTFKTWGHSLAPNDLRRLRFMVEAPEAATAFRFPIACNDGLPGLSVRRARTRPVPLEAASLCMEDGNPDRTFIGECASQDTAQPVFLRQQDRRQHLYISGQTGTGKTTLIKSMILSDMETGKGLAVIDPHGDLFEELVERVPTHRLDDVVLLDPTDVEFPVGLNLLECRNPDDQWTIIREMKSIIERLMFDQYGHAAANMTGPVFYQHMQMNMRLAMSNPDVPATLLELAQIFRDKDYWKRWLPLKSTDPTLKRWTEHMSDYTKTGSEALTLGGYFASKFDDFLFDPKLQRIFGQKRSTIDLRRIMDDGKILLVNLAKGNLSEASSRFLGMILMAKLQAVAMQRVDTPAHLRRWFYLYVDEFQSLATENFVLMLSEARKFKLSLVLANQFLSQVKDERIVESIFGNVGTLISFRIGHEDAAKLAPSFHPYFDAQDLTNLSNWQACVKTSVDGQTMPPFTINTKLPVTNLNTETADKVRERSRQKYAKPRAAVEEILRKSLCGLEDYRLNELVEALRLFIDRKPRPSRCKLKLSSGTFDVSGHAALLLHNVKTGVCTAGEMRSWLVNADGKEEIEKLISLLKIGK